MWENGCAYQLENDHIVWRKITSENVHASDVDGY